MKRDAYETFLHIDICIPMRRMISTYGYFVLFWVRRISQLSQLLHPAHRREADGGNAMTTKPWPPEGVSKFRAPQGGVCLPGRSDCYGGGGGRGREPNISPKEGFAKGFLGAKKNLPLPSVPPTGVHGFQSCRARVSTICLQPHSPRAADARLFKRCSKMA